MASAAASKRTVLGRSGPEVLGCASVGVATSALLLVAAAVVLAGLPYYLTPPSHRPDLPAHAVFASGSVLGILLGIVGAVLMVLLLLYSVHKWIPFLHFMGTSRFWMQFHVVCGLLGPLYIVLHAGVKFPLGFEGIGFWCMILVAVSGFFGRYLFGYFPAATVGRRADLDAEQKKLNDTRAQLVAQTREARADQIGEAVRLARDLHFEPRNLGELVVLDADVRRRAELIRVLLHRAELPKEVREKAERSLLAQLAARRNLAGFDVARRLLRYWNLFHQPIALAMYVIAFLHIVKSILFGGALQTLFGAL